MSPILSVRNLSTGYGKKPVLFGVDLTVMPGEVILITGGNGSGKSTLLKAIFGLLSPWNRDAVIAFTPTPSGPVLSTHPPLLNLSKGLAYLPQKHAVFDGLTAADNLKLSAHALGDGGEFETRRDEVLALLPAVSHLLRRKPDRMSGGERQMIALAMTLLHRPKLLMLDEPTAGLDSRNSEAILTVIRNLNIAHGVTVIAVEHRKNECAALGGRVCRMNLGVLGDD